NDQFCSGHFVPPVSRHAPDEREAEACLRTNVTSPSPRSRCAASLDHLVGEREQCGRNSEPDCTRSLQVDNQFEFGRLQHRQIGWFFAPKYPAGVDPSLPVGIEEAGPVAHHPASIHMRSPWIHCGYRMTRGQDDKQRRLAREEHVSSNKECIGSLMSESFKTSFQFVSGAGVENEYSLTNSAGCLPHIFKLG